MRFQIQTPLRYDYLVGGENTPRDPSDDHLEFGGGSAGGGIVLL